MILSTTTKCILLFL